MLVFIIISIWVLTLFAFTHKIQAKGHIDFFDNDGFIKVYFLGIRVFKARIYFEHDVSAHNNIIIKHGNKADKIHLNNDVTDKKSIVTIIRNPALKNILIHDIELHFTVGKTNNAFTTSLLLGAIRAGSYAVLAFLKSLYRMKVEESFSPVYNQDKLELDFLGIITISFADIIYSLVGAALKKAPKNQEVKSVDSAAR